MAKKISQDIEEPKTEIVKLDDLVFDPFNTNKMSDHEMNGLRESMKIWGFLKPIVVDQDNLVIDGEHRVKIYKEFNKKEIEAKRVHVNETQRRLLRQVMNKLHGQPDKKRDAMDLQFLEGDETAAVILDEILDIKESDIDEMTKFMDTNIQLDEPLDRNTDKRRRIVLFFSPTEYPKYRKKFDQLMESFKVNTEVEVVKNLVDEAVSIE